MGNGDAPSRRQTPLARAWAVWAVGVVAYAVAVFHRASLGVASLQAQHRFHASAAELSVFAVLQLAVYASLQIPVGVLLDRVGSRRLIAAGAVVMGLGQLTMALSHTVGLAVVARVLVGAGDAMTFISVLRVIGLWFPRGHASLVTQLTGLLGQLGQVAAAYPLVALLHGVGWTSTFVAVAAGSAVVAVAVLATLRDAPPDAAAAPTAASLAAVRAGVAAAWREPGTRLGLYTHLVAQFPGTVFALLWGFPFLVSGEGLSTGTAGVLLTVLVAVGMVVGPVLGRLAGRWPLRRSALTLTVVLSSLSAWTLVLAWPGRAPLGLLVVLVVVLGTNSPGSMIGFDYARSYNPAERLGSASGIVNVGGFVASLTTMLLVGLVLDVMTGGGPTSYTLGAFKAAFTVQYAVWAVGLTLLLRTRRGMRRELAESGVVLDPLPQAIARRWVSPNGRR